MAHIRYLTLFILLLSSITVYINRTNLNIAIVPMTSVNPSSRNTSVGREFPGGCPAPRPANASHEPPALTSSTLTQPAYDWDQVSQGKILGSFFYSYFLFMIPSGRLAERHGSRWIIFGALFGPAFASFTIPFVTDYHYAFLIICRFMLGIFQSGFYSAAYGMVCKWFPVSERSFAFAVVELGAFAGSVLTYASAGTIITVLGWQYLFYVPGIITLVVSILFILTTREHPERTPPIGDQISDGKEQVRSTRLKEVPVPWIAILSNKSVLSTMLFKFSVQVCTCFIYLEMPKYLSEMMHQDIDDNGSMNAIINIICVISMSFAGIFSEKIIVKEYMSRTTTRKMFSILVGTGTAVCFALIPDVAGCDVTSMYLLLCLSTFFIGFYTASDVPIVAEMTINFPSTLCALFNMIAMSAGFIVPYVTGAVLHYHEDPTVAWTALFYSCALLSFLSNIIFILFASAERQSFDMIDHEERIHLTNSHEA